MLFGNSAQTNATLYSNCRTVIDIARASNRYQIVSALPPSIARLATAHGGNNEKDSQPIQGKIQETRTSQINP